MFGKRFSRALAVTTVASLVMATAAFADTVVISNSVGVNDNVTKAPGTTGTGHVTLQVTNGAPSGDTNGCNATGGERLTVHLTSDNAEVTLTNSSVEVAGCGTDAAFDYSISAAATGTATISVASTAGGRTEGTRLYETSDTLVITITSPSDTAAPTNASIEINDGATWTNSAAVSVDISADDNVGITRYRLAETEAALASASDVAVSPAETAFGRTNVAFTLTGVDGASKAVWLSVYDAAGNSATASDSIGLDREAPTVTCAAASFLLNQPSASVSANVTDGLSGPATSPVSGAADTSSVGSKSISLTGYDLAGNSTVQSCTYTVGYSFEGLYAPVDRPNTMNVSKAGQAIPLKWRLTDFFGAPVTTLSTVTVKATTVSCGLGTTTDQVEEIASGSSGLQNLGDGYYQFNWKTPTSYANSCKTISLDLGGSLHGNLALFSFKK